MKRLLLLGGFVALVSFTWLGYSLLGSDTTSAPKMSQTSMTSDTPPATTGETSGPGEYRQYTEDAIATTSGTKILFFHAPWCSQCRELEADIEKQTLPSGLTIFKVDYDSNQPLRQKYGVTLQTTLVKVDDAGNLIEKYVAYSEPTYAKAEENLLR